MIPYIRVPDFTIGSKPVLVFGLQVLPFALHPFGILVAMGVLVGIQLATRRARILGYDTELLNSFLSRMLFFGFFLSHVLDQIFYHPEEILRRPQSLLFFWEGLSSFGGFVGALVGIFSWKYYDWAERSVGPLRVSFFKRRPEPIPVLPFMDLVIAIFPIGWIFGRTGCSVVHDHPGARVPEPNWLSVAYPLSGEHAKTVSYGPIELVWGSAYRYDLGLVELMFTVLLCVFLVPSWGRALAMGTYLSVIPLAYAPVRFVMDFLRIREGESADRRYGELTFAQWLCIALFMAGIYMALKVCRLHASGSDLTRLVRAPDHTRSVRTFGAAPSSAS